MNEDLKPAWYQSWRSKLLFMAGIIMLTNVLAVAVGSAMIAQHNGMMQLEMEESQRRQDAASEVRMALLQRERAEAFLLAARDANQRRQAAVAMIQNTSVLEELIQGLRDELPQEGKISELGELIERIKPAQLEIVRFGRSAQMDAAHAKMQEISELTERVTTLSAEILHQQQERIREAMDNNRRAGGETIQRMWLIVLLGIAAGGALSLIVSNRISRPIRTLHDAIARAAQGDLSVRTSSDKLDEIGLALAQMSRAALSMGEIIGAIQTKAVTLSGESQTLADTSEGLDACVRKLQERVKHIQRQSETALGSIEGVRQDLHAAADNSATASQHNDLVASKVDAIRSDFELFQGRITIVTESARGLSEYANMISSITATIREIAEQTNLLALNASIEAARAGDAGRGFAVVASEVGALAKRSRQATNEISNLAGDVIRQINQTVTSLDTCLPLVDKNMSELSDVVGISRDSTQNSREATRAVSQLLNGIQEYQSALETIAEHLNGVSGTYEKIDGFSYKLRAQSEGMKGEVHDMKSLSERFKV
jgi:methyl-accepting chemotaxis protein